MDGAFRARALRSLQADYYVRGYDTIIGRATMHFVTAYINRVCLIIADMSFERFRACFRIFIAHHRRKRQKYIFFLSKTVHYILNDVFY
jgi:hypothetical protein